MQEQKKEKLKILVVKYFSIASKKTLHHTERTAERWLS